MSARAYQRLRAAGVLAAGVLVAINIAGVGIAVVRGDGVALGVHLAFGFTGLAIMYDQLRGGPARRR